MKLRSVAFGGCLGWAVVWAGCGGAPSKRREVTDAFFFPPPPAAARVQYLRSFRSSADVSRRSALMEFVAGPDDLSQYTVVKPFGVAAWNGRVYVTDSFGARGLNVFDFRNETSYILGKKPGPGLLAKPIHVFVDDEGFKYVSDIARGTVIVFGPDDSYVRSYGDGTSFTPVSCVVHGNELFILDMQKDLVEVERDGEAIEREKRRDQILVLDKDTGKPLRRIGEQGRPEVGFAYASFLAVDPLGKIYVSDFLHHRVAKLDSEGNVYLDFGQHGNRPPALPKPKGLAVDRQGLIYIVDAELEVVQVFDNAGQLLFYFGEWSAAEGRMTLPAGVWIDYTSVEDFRGDMGPDFEPEYLIFVANQIGNPSVAVYAYGTRRGHEYPDEEKVVDLSTARATPLAKLPVFPPDVYRSATLVEEGSGTE